MTKAAVVQTDLQDSSEAGSALGNQISRAFQGERPDALILFASPRYEFAALLRALDAACHPAVLVGSSSAGEFTSQSHGVGMACAVALRAPEMCFQATLGRGLSKDSMKASRELTAGFRGISNPSFAYRTALVLTDALAGHADALVEHISALTGGIYKLFGGGAGGDDQFQGRAVFFGTEAVADAVVALEMLSNKVIGVGVRHGWSPTSGPLRVTEAEGTRVGSLNAVAAAEVFEEHAERTGQKLDRTNALPFFLHNVLGVDTGTGHKLRVPLAVNDDGSVACATEVPEGTTACVMGVSSSAAAEAAANSTKDALRQLEGNKPAVALFFDCVATRLRMGKDFGFELNAVQKQLGSVNFAGCNSIGQIASAEGQFSGFHNCTAVVCIIPE